jgi:hypothetical protein
VRPQIRAGPKPGHVIATSGSAKGSWPKRGNVVVYVMPSLRACRARPSEGWASQCRMALRGEPGDNAKGDFLGGTHSVRPPGKAVRMPRHFIPTRCVAERARPSGICLGEAGALIAGVRSPPLRVGLARVKGLAGKTRG